MAFSFDFTADFFTLDNLQPLTLRVAGQPDQAIRAALNTPAAWTDPDEAGGQVLEGDQVWAWPIVFTPARPPLGSTLFDQYGTNYVVLAVERIDIMNLWQARGRNLSVVYGLDNLATVLEATYSQSPGGEALPTWNPVLEGIAARFQPVAQDAQILEDAEWPRTTYHVFLGTDIFAPEIPVEPASADFRLVDSAGRHYRIVKYQRAERIDALPMAVCVLVIEGEEGGAGSRVSSSSGS
jgi:hypothetical protein